jgi:hypothetical protein
MCIPRIALSLGSVAIHRQQKTLLKIYGPNHEKTKWFLQKEDRLVRKWNRAAMWRRTVS